MRPLVYDALRYVRPTCRTGAQRQSRALPIILLIAALDFAAASVANGQTTIGPGVNPGTSQGNQQPPVTIGSAPIQTTLNVQGSTTINTSGNVFVAPTTGAPTPVTLNINSASGPTPGPITINAGPPTAPTAPVSSLVINGGGTGQPSQNNNTLTAITANVIGSGINLTSSGQGVAWLQGAASTLNVTGTSSPSDIVFTGNGVGFPNNQPQSRNQEATVVAVQQGATANLTNVTLNLGGPAGFQQASKMALCVGGCGLSGSFGPPPNGGNGGNATLNNVVINDTANTSAGIWVSRTGTMTMTGGSINLLAGSDNSQAVHADINGRPVLNHVAITTDGANSVGALARTFEPGNTGIPGGFASGIITLNDGSSITTNGANSTGALAAGAGLARAGNSTTGAVTSVNPSQIILNGTDAMPIDIKTNGMNSIALAVCSCSQVSFSDPNFGPTFVQMVGGTITATNTNVMTMMAGSTGVSAQDGGTISLTNGTVTVEGAGGSGYFVNGIGVNGVSSNITATNTVAETMGANSPGGLLTNGGTLTINGGRVTTIGAGSDGFLFMPVTSVPTVSQPVNPGISAGDPTQPNTLTITNATVASAADAFHVIGVPANITVSGSTVTDNNGVLLSTQSSGATNMMVSGSQLSGAILTDMISNPLQSQGTLSTANVTLQNNTTWTMTGSSNLTNLTNSASNIIYTPPTGDPTQLSSYKTLTVMKNSAGFGGNYTGVGGMMTMNTFLGADSSPSDRLVINGGAGDGTTGLTIHNTTGAGALTLANGILVVQAVNGGATTPTAAANGAAVPGDAFSLTNELRGGAFDYRLFRGGPVDSGDPSIANSWFLRNVFVTPPIEPPPGPPEDLVPPPGPGEPPVLPPTPPPTPLPPNVEAPIIGPELATYGVVQPLARELGLSILGTLNDRVGDTYEPDGYAVEPVAPAELPTKKGALPTKKPGQALAPRPLFSPSVWGRFFGQTVNNHYGAFADPRASGNLGGFQGGIDLLRGPMIPGGFDRAGLYGAYGNVNSDVTGLVTNSAATAYVLTHTGSMSLNAWSAGGYWTHVGPGGWYLDGVLQGTWYYGSASTADARLNTDGTGFIASLEGGVPFALPQLGPGFVLEPQGQILWQKVSFRHDYDGLGDVALGDTTGPSGRVGLRGKWTIVTGGGQVWQPYLRANLWRDWGADANTDFAGTAVPLLSQITTLELGGGVTGRINANVSVFANVDYEFAVGAANGQRQNGVRGAFGARYTW